MIKKTSTSMLRHFVMFALCLVFCLVIFGGDSCFAEVKAQGLTDAQLDRFAANQIYFYDPGECVNKVSNNIGTEGCFKVDTNTSATDFWYWENSIQNYPKIAYTNTSEKDNDTLISETMTDDEFGGLQYIYAENYDIDYTENTIDGWVPRFTKNGGDSTRKYYWIVLISGVYSTGFGETYVATFENLDEPIYFITYDAHACKDLLGDGVGTDYCSMAQNDPDSVALGYHTLGAISETSGGISEAANKAGKLKSLCRIKGRGEVQASMSDTGVYGGTFNNSVSDQSGGGGSTNNSTSVVGNIHEDSDNIGCANGTKDLGIDTEAYDHGYRITIRLCSVPNITSTSETDTDGYIHVNSRASGAYYALGEKYKELYGSTLSASQSYRTMEQQEYFWGCYQSGSCNKGYLAAKPGYSNHQLGTAVDFAMDGSGWGDTGISGFFNEYLAEYGLARNVSSEDWHVSHASDENPDSTGSDCTSHEGDYPFYSQSNYDQSDHENSSEDWTTIPYGEGTVASSGCGPTSMAMLTTAATGKDVYPQDIINATKASGSYTLSAGTELDKIVGEKYGIEVIAESYSSKDDAYEKMKKYLNDGYMIHLSGHCLDDNADENGACNGFSTKHTKGHYIGLFSIDGQDNVSVANSGKVGNSTVPLQDIVNIIHHEVFSAIKGNGNGGGSNCFDYCSNGSASGESVGDDGLTIEQAKTFMMNYGENKNDSSKNAVGEGLWTIDCNGGGGSNCVTFSAFFMSKFTTIANANGRWGAGDEVVNKLKERNVEATYGTEPKVYAVLSTEPQHTAVVLGHHDGKWIVGHASCGYTGVGRGNGGSGSLEGDSKGGGAGFIAIEESDDPLQWQWMKNKVEFAYPNSVDTEGIKEYLENGT